MIDIKEICKRRGITQAELAQRMGISASTLAQSIHGNPRLDRVQAIADALNISIGELFPHGQGSFTALISYEDKLFKATTFERLNDIINHLKVKEMLRTAKEFRIEKPYGMIYNIACNKALVFNREYQRIGETSGIISIFNAELENVNLSGLTKEMEEKLFETIRIDKGNPIGFFYSDKTSPCISREDEEKQLDLIDIYNQRIDLLFKLLPELQNMWK
ncbi:helix-turn-helix domain-containing protein [Bacteroides sedimenti]|uniref:HTH cro/C1-type domain-containing protein n=1 Tax=Bacteroides sedimenti TaxID=2136147 RepID=A0ABM8IBZ6_9BACE